MKIEDGHAIEAKVTIREVDIPGNTPTLTGTDNGSSDFARNKRVIVSILLK